MCCTVSIKCKQSATSPVSKVDSTYDSALPSVRICLLTSNRRHLIV